MSRSHYTSPTQTIRRSHRKSFQAVKASRLPNRQSRSSSTPAVPCRTSGPFGRARVTCASRALDVSMAKISGRRSRPRGGPDFASSTRRSSDIPGNRIVHVWMRRAWTLDLAWGSTRPGTASARLPQRFLTRHARRQRVLDSAHRRAEESNRLGILGSSPRNRTRRKARMSDPEKTSPGHGRMAHA